MEAEGPQFDMLRRLLALKRHEVPPPGFFKAFPKRVRARILAAESHQAGSWWERVRSWSGWRPALAGACVAAVCGFWLWPRGQGPGAPPSGGEWVGRAGFVESATMATPLAPGSPEGSLRWAEAVNSMAPQGLFTPGIGLRGVLSPAAATSGISGLVVTGVPQSTLPFPR